MTKGTSPRHVFETLLKDTLPDSALADIRAADDYVDSALRVIEWEEPSLLEWLSGDEQIDSVLKMNATAMFALIIADQQRNFQWERTVRRLEAMVYRTSVAIAWNAAMRERKTIRDL